MEVKQTEPGDANPSDALSSTIAALQANIITTFMLLQPKNKHLEYVVTCSK